MIRIGDRVQFQSGGVMAMGIVKDVHASTGVFVHADTLVPVKLGNGPIIQHDRLWCPMPGVVVYDRDGAKVGLRDVEGESNG